ncbi:hypothetical protein AURDEDRAFT_113473, partial [Auricularia subglabra TFB-10046 SS5]
MYFATFALAALFAAVPAKAFTAWSGDACNGARGNDVACNGACIDFSGRHSFVANSAGQSGTHCVAFYVDGGCNGQRFNFTGQGAQCTNVNTGTAINSFRCFGGAGCS